MNVELAIETVRKLFTAGDPLFGLMAAGSWARISGMSRTVCTKIN